MVSRASIASSMEDPLCSLDEFSSPTNPSVHSGNPSHNHHVVNQTRYLNLTNPSNPFCLDTGDNPTVILVMDLLTGDNYSTLLHVMRRALRVKKKLGFISGSIPKPTDPNDLLFNLWERCNDMVVSWLQNSISPSIKSNVAFVDDTREIWLDHEDHFSHQNESRIYQFKKTLASLLQESDNASVYYSNLKTLWDELLIYNSLPICTCGSIKILSDRYR